MTPFFFFFCFRLVCITVTTDNLKTEGQLQVRAQKHPPNEIVVFSKIFSLGEQTTLKGRLCAAVAGQQEMNSVAALEVAYISIMMSYQEFFFFLFFNFFCLILILFHLHIFFSLCIYTCTHKHIYMHIQEHIQTYTHKHTDTYPVYSFMKFLNLGMSESLFLCLVLGSFPSVYWFCSVCFVYYIDVYHFILMISQKPVQFLMRGREGVDLDERGSGEESGGVEEGKL